MKSFRFACFGGQGIVLMSQVMAHAGVREGKEVFCLPSYGAEMRGGTSNCLVTMSEGELEAPITAHVDVLVAMNQFSLDRFELSVKPGGLLLYNTSLIGGSPSRKDVQVLGVPATGMAEKIGRPLLANMIALGLLAGKGYVGLEALEAALKEMLSGNPELLADDLTAVRNGAEFRGE